MSEHVGWRNRIVGEGEQPASQFIANPNNWRVHPQAQRDAMRGALNEVGWVQRVIVNRRTGHLVDGHERVWQALQNNDALVPYVEVDLSEAEEAYVLATLDPLGAMAQADAQALNELLRETQTSEASVQAMLAELATTAKLHDEMTRAIVDDGEFAQPHQSRVAPTGKMIVVGVGSFAGLVLGSIVDQVIERLKAHFGDDPQAAMPAFCEWILNEGLPDRNGSQT